MRKILTLGLSASIVWAIGVNPYAPPLPDGIGAAADALVEMMKGNKNGVSSR